MTDPGDDEYRRAVLICEEGRQSHAEWRDHLAAHLSGEPCPKCTPDVLVVSGDHEFQVLWVESAAADRPLVTADCRDLLHDPPLGVPYPAQASEHGECGLRLLLPHGTLAAPPFRWP